MNTVKFIQVAQLYAFAVSAIKEFCPYVIPLLLLKKLVFSWLIKDMSAVSQPIWASLSLARSCGRYCNNHLIPKEINKWSYTERAQFWVLGANVLCIFALPYTTTTEPSRSVHSSMLTKWIKNWDVGCLRFSRVQCTKNAISTPG